MKKLSSLLKNLPAVQISGSPNVDITGIAFDSREVKPGSLFVAIRGMLTDGNEFVQQAVDAGAAAIVSERSAPADFPLAYLQVENSRIALAELSIAFYDSPHRDVHVIGITGTNGKTTTAYLIRSIFEAAGRPTGLLGTVEYIVGNETIPSSLTTPESLHINRYLDTMRRAGQHHAVLEASSHGIAMERTHGLHFRNVVFTNLSQDHLDFHKSEEAYLAAKSRLFENMTAEDVAFVNTDDAVHDSIRRKTGATVMSYSLWDPSADFYGEMIDSKNNHKTLRITWRGQQFDITTELKGRHNLYNVLSAAAVALVNDVNPEQIRTGVKKLQQIRGRLEAVEGDHPFKVFVDFAHNPDALKQTLLACREIADGKKVHVVFGCGGGRDPMKRPVMGRMAQEFADLVYLTSDNPRLENPEQILREITSGITDTSKCTQIVDRRTAIYEALEKAETGDVVLIAGKGHETYQDIGGEKLPFDDRVVVKEIL